MKTRTTFAICLFAGSKATFLMPEVGKVTLLVSNVRQDFSAPRVAAHMFIGLNLDSIENRGYSLKSPSELC